MQTQAMKILSFQKKNKQTKFGNNDGIAWSMAVISG